MHGQGGNYEAFKALHEARMQSVRASAVSAGLTKRDRKTDGPFRRLTAWLGQRQAAPERVVPEPSPESLFWA